MLSSQFPHGGPADLTCLRWGEILPSLVRIRLTLIREIGGLR
jgi:hypothetical protein